MSRKSEVAYRAVLETMRVHLIPSLKVLNLITDFEPALQNSLGQVFPDSILHGCFFHHCHAILKYRQKFAMLSRVMRVDKSLKSKALAFQRDLMNLALLPARLIPGAFNDLRERLRQNKKLYTIMHPLCDYYDSYWIKQIGPALYSVYEQEHRTNNVIERYHRDLKAEMATKPELYKFLDALKRIQQRYHLTLFMVEHGGSPNKRRDKKCLQRQEQITTAWGALRDIDSLTDPQKRLHIETILTNLRFEDDIFTNIDDKPENNESTSIPMTPSVAQLRAVTGEIEAGGENIRSHQSSVPSKGVPRIVRVERVEKRIKMIKRSAGTSLPEITSQASTVSTMKIIAVPREKCLGLLALNGIFRKFT